MLEYLHQEVKAEVNGQLLFRRMDRGAQITKDILPHISYIFDGGYDPTGASSRDIPHD